MHHSAPFPITQQIGSPTHLISLVGTPRTILIEFYETAVNSDSCIDTEKSFLLVVKCFKVHTSKLHCADHMISNNFAKCFQFASLLQLESPFVN